MKLTSNILKSRESQNIYIYIYIYIKSVYRKIDPVQIYRLTLKVTTREINFIDCLRDVINEH